MKKLESSLEINNAVIDIHIKNMIIKDLTHAYDNLPTEDRLMRFYIAKAITDLHITYMHKNKK